MTTDPQTERRDRYAETMARTDGWEWAAANFSSLSTPTADRYRRAAEAVMAIADAEQAELRREHAERLDHIEGALARIRDKGEVVQVRGRKVLTFAEDVLAKSGPGVARSAVQAVVDRLRAALAGEPHLPADDPSRRADEEQGGDGK